MDGLNLISRLPYPVARPCAIAFDIWGDSSLQVQVWDLMFAGYQVLRMATLPVAAAYLAHPLSTEKMSSQKAVGSIARALAGLRCPSYSNWAALPRTFVRHMTEEKVGMEPCLPLKQSVERLKHSSFT